MMLIVHKLSFQQKNNLIVKTSTIKEHGMNLAAPDANAF